MCGIGGALSRTDDLQTLLPLIIENQHRRGPDFHNLVNLNSQDMQLSLAHNRLAVLDLTDGSNQPFIDPTTGACIVFNGEIYNYHELRAELEALGANFITRGDTEVLLKAFLIWGKAAYHKLNGMFAFAIWTPQTQSLLLARDRFGVKPCYYYNQSDRFAFASTTQALARFFNPHPSVEYLSHGILYHLFEDVGGSSPFEQIHSLPPGHILEVRGNEIKLESVYDLETQLNPDWVDLDFESSLKLVESTLRSAVEVRLRSDVPVTLSLSGGLDSALIASYAKELSSRPIEAFCFGHPDDRFSEAKLAKLTADHLGIKLHFVDLPIDRMVDTFEKVLFDQEAPFADPTVMAQNRVFEAINRIGLKVSLGGQGSDEVFMGYRKFQFFHFKELLKNKNFLGTLKSGIGLAQMLASDVDRLIETYQQRRRYSKNEQIVSPFRNHVLGDHFALRLSAYKNLRARQIADVGAASLLTLLRYEDRNSMGHSVESRMPFLDYRMMALGSSLPVEHKLKHGYGKYILRVLANRRGLPKQIAFTRAKKAFANNAQEWLGTGKLAEHLFQGVDAKMAAVKDVFSDASLKILKDKDSYLDPQNFPLAVTANWLIRQI